jgi:hypothetical protein
MIINKKDNYSTFDGTYNQNESNKSIWIDLSNKIEYLQK